MITPFGPWVVLHKRQQTGVDRYNRPVYASSDRRVQSVYFEAGGSTEDPDVGAVQTTTLYLSPEVDASWLDAVTVDGQRYEVDGKPGLGRRNPWTNWRPCVEVTLRLPSG